ncbi:MAG TPA: hypothetical protein PLX92_04935 [Anaerolineaceae bacterium]|nr:hypothetical protein [Anaerolineaceae bacterium]HUM49534.1 hypothetical protein [Anaerolineaceae bacterium]
MEAERIKSIVEALAGPDVLSYALKEDGVLVVIDQNGQKRVYLPTTYHHLLRQSQRSTKMVKGVKDD